MATKTAEKDDSGFDREGMLHPKPNSIDELNKGYYKKGEEAEGTLKDETAEAATEEDADG